MVTGPPWVNPSALRLVSEVDRTMGPGAWM